MNDKSLLGPWVRRFLLEYAVKERNLAPNTQHSYRDTLSLLIPFIAKKAGSPIERLIVVDASAERVRLSFSILKRLAVAASPRGTKGLPRFTLSPDLWA